MIVDDAPYVSRHTFYVALAPFPVACFVLTLLTDLAYWATASIIWETMSVWLLTIGLSVAALAILVGFVGLIRRGRARGLGQPRVVIAGYVLAFGLSMVNVFVHSRDGYTAVVPQGLTLSFLVVLVLLSTAFMGRVISSRSRVGGFV